MAQTVFLRVGFLNTRLTELKNFKSIILIIVFGIFTIGCTSFKISKPEPNDDFGSPEYLDISNFNYYHRGPELPLRQVDRFSLTAAPIENVFGIGDAVVMVTKNGRVYGSMINGKKIRGKLKLENNSDGFATLYKNRYLIIALKLANKSLLCYDLQRGRYLWKVNAGLQGAKPLVADSTIYTISRFKHVSRYSLASGRRLWRKRTGSFAHTTGAIVDNLLVFGTDEGKVLALTRRTGEKIWETNLKGPIYSAPVFDGTNIYITSVAGEITALAPENGAVVWQKNITGGIWKTPALKGQTLVVPTADGTLYSIRTIDGATLWQYAIHTPVGTSPIIIDDLIYFGGTDRNLYALNLADGSVAWQVELKGRVRTDPAVSGDYLLVGSENKYVYVFAHDAERSQK